MPSKTDAKKMKTTARSSTPRMVTGIVLLVLGLAWLLSLFTGAKSGVMGLLSSTLQGLGGSLCMLFPLCLLWAGVLCLVSAHKKVSVRAFVICFFIYLFLLGCMTMMAKPGGVFYMDTIKQKNTANFSTNHIMYPDSFSSFLQFAYNMGSKSWYCGGILGMLVAFPLWKTVGNVGGIIVSILAMLGLVLLLTRVNLMKVFRGVSDSMEGQRVKREERRAQEEAEQAAYEEQLRQEEMSRKQELPLEPVTPQGQTVYHEQTVLPPRYRTKRNEGFTEVQAGDIYQEYFPRDRDDARSAPEPIAPEPERYAADDPLYPDDSLYPDTARTKRTTRTERKAARAERQNVPVKRETSVPDEQVTWQDDEDGDIVTDTQESPAAQQSFTEKKPEATARTPLFSSNRAQPAAAPDPAPAPVMQASDAQEDDDLPWYTEDDDIPPLTGDEAKALVRETTPQPAAQRTAPERPPRPVGVAPAVQMTGKRIPIQVQIHDEVPVETTFARMDGTPTVKTSTIEMNVTAPYPNPPARLLNDPDPHAARDTSGEDNANAARLQQTLASFRINAEVKQITHGPAITRFALRLDEGVKVKSIANIVDNIALDMAVSTGVRIEAPIPGTNLVGIEVPHKTISAVTLREVLDSPEMHQNTSTLAVAIGKDIAGTPIICNLAKMPHLLIAGQTGSGKSVCINSIINSLLYRTSPEDVRLIMIDPKMVELQVYNGIPHLLVPVVSDPRKAASVLNWAVIEMLDRYNKFSECNVRGITGYNKALQAGEKKMPNIVIIIDELADLMMACKKDVEESIRRLSALARAAGIFLVVATQRPSVDVITGVIKANIPSRIAFAVSSNTDSRTIIDGVGAEKLLGRGDMLYMPTGEMKALRVQGCFVSDEEVGRVTDYIKTRCQPDYNPDIIEHIAKDSAGQKDDDAPDSAHSSNDAASDTEGDDASDGYLAEAIEMAVESGQMSISMLQRRLRVGYARAGRLIDEMTRRGIISDSEGSKPRKTLISREDLKNMNL